MNSNLSPIIIIGASTGGPQTLEKIIFQLPATNIAPILVVQHMPQYFTAEMAKRFNKLSKIQVLEAINEQEISQNSIVIAAGGHNLTVDKDFRTILDSSIADGKFKPSIDVAMKSIAENHGEQSIAILLTGMGKDGLEGAKAIKAAGGRVIAQDPKTCIIRSMPKNIIDANLTDEILTPELIIQRIIQLSK